MNNLKTLVINMKLKLYDQVKIIKDIDADSYPKTATDLKKMSKKLIGKITAIDSIKKGKYPYMAIVDNFTYYFSAKELKFVKHAKIKKYNGFTTINY